MTARDQKIVKLFIHSVLVSMSEGLKQATDRQAALNGMLRELDKLTERMM